MDFLEKIIQLILDLFKKKKEEPKPDADDSYDYIQHRGHSVEQTICIDQGSFSAEVWVPEVTSENRPVWERSNIFSITDGSAGNCYEVRGYKIKACTAGVCREPRYNLKWGQWRKIVATWTPKEFHVTIDKTPITAKGSADWGPTVKLVYGDTGFLFDGVKMRNIEIQ